MCKNAMVLHDGACQSECPGGTSSVGQGNFNKRCEQVCVPKANNCHHCHPERSACAMCKNGMFLHDGTCKPACPVGTKASGQGNFNKRCE
jgi:hypothetical protein